MAHHVCNKLVASGQLKEKPEFIRKDREDILAQLFKSIGLNGRVMTTFTDTGMLDLLVPSCAEGEGWVDSVLTELKLMLSDEVRRSSGRGRACGGGGDATGHMTSTGPQKPGRVGARSLLVEVDGETDESHSLKSKREGS